MGTWNEDILEGLLHSPDGPLETGLFNIRDGSPMREKAGNFRPLFHHTNMLIIPTQRPNSNNKRHVKSSGNKGDGLVGPDDQGDEELCTYKGEDVAFGG